MSSPSSGFLPVHHGTVVPASHLTPARKSQGPGNRPPLSGELLAGAASRAVRLTAEETPHSRKQAWLLLRASAAAARHAGSILLAATHWASSRLPVCQGRGSRHPATVNVCWRWRNLACSQLRPCSLPEPCRAPSQWVHWHGKSSHESTSQGEALCQPSKEYLCSLPGKQNIEVKGQA